MNIFLAGIFSRRGQSGRARLRPRREGRAFPRPQVATSRRHHQYRQQGVAAGPANTGAAPEPEWPPRLAGTLALPASRARGILPRLPIAKRARLCYRPTWWPKWLALPPRNIPTGAALCTRTPPETATGVRSQEWRQKGGRASPRAVVTKQ